MYSPRAFSRLSHIRQPPVSRRWFSEVSRFSVHGNANNSKSSLITTIKGAQLDHSKQKDALLILASRQFASWLQDEKFMGSLIEPFSASNQDTSGFHTLAAAVDGLQPLQTLGEIPHGFSFYRGNLESLFPNLWKDSQSKPSSNTKLQASLNFQLSPLNTFSSSTTCTMPLANTIFQNGRQSTLLATRWSRSGNTMVQAEVAEKQTQDVCFHHDLASAETAIEAPLVPITAPRKILSGLGNIIRQIEVNDQPAPASKELETAVQTLFDRRLNEGHEFPPGPVGVWAVVVPPSAKQSEDVELLREWASRLNENSTAEDEWKHALDTKGFMRGLLSHGTRVYRILSGGGGWGKKQGLLSLDPETKYSPSSEEEDLDSFIRSFSSQHDGKAQEGVVAPGSYVQYFVSPPATAKPALSPTQSSFANVAFGASESALAEDTASTEGPSGWEIVPGHFGAVSSHGLFIASQGNTLAHTTETKLDVPDTWVGYHN
ncbi:hypothetical protein CGCA056_v000650 [Colletotrichum aenigma]|uniref:uncharacterized protein n=1 Tax=Colletotrichum aenigma TaxID=1215731 RepID=UPI00187304A0|nr:uncharacterized protein CGCA056_v000650 [Colletotrichum aenigma]KAF5527322.1 hypothetical protein CGCA056_v000650 [Colletotrichum aenigma]